MSRRTKRPARPVVPTSCPCGLPAAYVECCGRYHSGAAAAPTAEALMRSRFSAFAVQDGPYLLRTWHPDTRPAEIDFDPGMRWTRLEILDTADGSAFHSTGTVTFRAHYTHGGEAGSLHEQSRFSRVDGAWVYLDAIFTE
ncbi:YchJ family protein [Streptomyces sp. NPDC050516]|uniref:YchJ family protein n=1 Tax=Streptomyces sp. NPDC050516 TaxID=3365621 RepID=UPI0037A26D9D